jgi:hypothetical protein
MPRARRISQTPSARRITPPRGDGLAPGCLFPLGLRVDCGRIIAAVFIDRHLRREPDGGGEDDLALDHVLGGVVDDRA